MEIKAFLLLCVVLMFSTTIVSQDTISVYFGSGTYKLDPSQLAILDSIPNRYNITDLDSIHYIGMADSIGRVSANMRLFKKRANNVRKYCSSMFFEELPTRTFALGEKNNAERSKNRSVDLIIYYGNPLKSANIYTNKDSVILEVPCLNIDYATLSFCNLSVINKNNKEHVMLEREPLIINKKKNPNKRKNFYGYTDISGEFQMKRVKWKRKTTGTKWWRKTRYVAEVPKEDYDLYKIFVVNNNCDSCCERFQSRMPISNESICKAWDNFLIKNVQFKIKPFSYRLSKIRVPQEYVSIEDQYFISLSFNAILNDYELKWETKKGRRKQKYYYYYLPKYI